MPVSTGFLADWCEEHPEAKPLNLSLHVFFDPRVAGIEYQNPPVDPRYSKQRLYLTSEQFGPHPGWYAVSVHQLYSRTKEFAYLFDFPKTDMIGYSIYIYHLTQEQVDDWNRKHGFVKAESGEPKGGGG
jgi:aromatic ring-cleaving dioxygenase